MSTTRERTLTVPDGGAADVLGAPLTAALPVRVVSRSRPRLQGWRGPAAQRWFSSRTASRKAARASRPPS